MEHRTADMSILDLPIALRISDKRIKYLSSLVIDAGKSKEDKIKTVGKIHRAYNNITKESFIGTTKVIGAKIFDYLAPNSQISMVNGLYHKRYKPRNGWEILDV